jgi:hypothetical protein
MQAGSTKKRSMYVGAFVSGFIVLGLLAIAAFAGENPIPWKVGGYESISEVHMKFLSASRDAFESLKNFMTGKHETEICEIWYRKHPKRFRVDDYVEAGTLRCNKFKGKEWEKIAENGKTYVLKSRTIQIGDKRISYNLENISSGGGTELCEYKRFEAVRSGPASIKDVLPLMPLTPYVADPDAAEMIGATLDMDKVMNPDKYKKTMAELKKRHDVAGRTTAKWNTNHGLIRFAAQGPVSIDLEWGIALEGYLTEGREGWGSKPVILEKPELLYKVLSIETKISDPTVFGEQ